MESKDFSWVASLPILEVLVGEEVGHYYHPFLHLNLTKNWKNFWVDLPLTPYRGMSFRHGLLANSMGGGLLQFPLLLLSSSSFVEVSLLHY
jgi:hypothetical protein